MMDDNLAIFLLMFVAIGAAVGLIGLTTWIRASRRADRSPSSLGIVEEAQGHIVGNERLREHIAYLEARLVALEQIATDPATRTAREIDALAQGARA